MGGPYQLSQALLRLVVLRGLARMELVLLALQLGRVGLVLEPGEDLRQRQSGGRAVCVVGTHIVFNWRRHQSCCGLQLAVLAPALED